MMGVIINTRKGGENAEPLNVDTKEVTFELSLKG